MATVAERSLDTIGNKSRKIRAGKKRRLTYHEWFAYQMKHNQKMSRLLLLPSPFWSALSGEDMDIVARTAKQLGNCSTVQFIGITPDKKEVVQDTYTCHSRFCEICANRRSKEVQKRMAGWYVDGATVMDGRGKLAGNRTREEVSRWMVSQVELQSALNRLPEDQPELSDVLQKILDDGEKELQHEAKPLYWHFITLTIPNIPHVWERDANGNAINWLDVKILQPWRKLWRASRAKKSGKASREKKSKHRKFLTAKRPKKDKKKKKNAKRGRKPIAGLSLFRMMLGYMGRLEITFNKKARTFHPHIHLLVVSQSRWIPRPLVLAAWQYYTSVQTRNVQVKKADPSTVGKELVKYVTKTADLEDDAEAAKELARALYGRRTLFTGGAMYGIRWSETVAQWEKERAYMKHEPTEGRHVRRTWNPKTNQWDYEILGDSQTFGPVKGIAARQRVVTLDGEITTQKYRNNALDRKDIGRTHGRPQSEEQRWRNVIVSETKAKFRRYWAQSPVEYAWEWLLVGVLSAIAAPVAGWEKGRYVTQTEHGTADHFDLNCEPCRLRLKPPEKEAK